MHTNKVTLERLLDEAVEDCVAPRIEQGLFPSAVIRVFSSDKTLFQKAYGQAQVDSVFDVASLTKLATATQILLLISEGRLGLHDKLIGILDSLASDELLKSRLSETDIYALLTHTSGIVDWYPFYAHKGQPFERVLAIALERYAPVSGMVYSDLNFMLLGKVIEKLQGKPLDQCLKQHLVEPYGLGVMGYAPMAAEHIIASSYGNPIEEQMCATRSIHFDGWRPHEALSGGCNDGNAYYYFNGVAGSAGIFADAAAYEGLARLYMRTGDPLLVQALQAHESNRGLGFQTGEMYPQGCGHTGFTGTSLYFSRSLDVGVVAFTNRLLMEAPLPEGMQAFRKELHEAVVKIVKGS